MQRATLVFLFNQKNQILLGMKKRGFGLHKRNGFGGKPHGQESPLQTSVRELYEESTISISPDSLQKCGVLHFFFENKPERNQTVYVYKGVYDGKFEETEEMLPQWRDIKDLPYDQMREDDQYWLPELIADTQFEMTFRFDQAGKLIR